MDACSKFGGVCDVVPGREVGKLGNNRLDLKLGGGKENGDGPGGLGTGALSVGRVNGLPRCPFIGLLLLVF